MVNPPVDGATHLPTESTEQVMRRAVIYRVIRRNCFAVKIDNLPGVSEVRCNKLEVENREQFEKQCRKLEPGTESGAEPVQVMLNLGQYCMSSRAFVNCQLKYPCTSDEAEAATDDEDGEVSHKRNQSYGAVEKDIVKAARVEEELCA